MKLLRLSETGKQEFEGRTCEQAIARARKALGNETALHCWRVRRGGVFGFFAKETFVAGVTPPQNLVKSAASGALRSELDLADGSTDADDDWSAQLLKYAERTTLSRLIEETSDEVTLCSDHVPESIFSDVLTEAEAALSKTRTVVDGSLMPYPMEATYSVPSKPDLIDGFLESLAEIGVPPQYRPSESEATLDGLFRSVSKLPEPKHVPEVPGSTIVVVGRQSEAEEAARGVLSSLGLESAKPLLLDQSESGRLQIVFRQCAKKISVVVVDVPLKPRVCGEAADWIRQLNPDYVLGAVAATAKRSDVLRWCDRIGGVDSLAISGLSDTATPGELMGATPVAYLNGMTASPLRWISALLEAIVGRRQ